jgi:hypothetical protein
VGERSRAEPAPRGDWSPERVYTFLSLLFDRRGTESLALAPNDAAVVLRILAVRSPARWLPPRLRPANAA